MASLLSNLVNNSAEGIHKFKCKYRHNKKKNCECFLEYTNVKDNLIKYKCLYCNKNYQKKFDENLKKRFFIVYTFSNHDINKFILLLQKDVCPYEYMDDWEKRVNIFLQHYLKKKIFTVT